MIIYELRENRGPGSDRTHRVLGLFSTWKGAEDVGQAIMSGPPHNGPGGIGMETVAHEVDAVLDKVRRGDRPYLIVMDEHGQVTVTRELNILDDPRAQDVFAVDRAGTEQSAIYKGVVWAKSEFDATQRVREYRDSEMRTRVDTDGGIESMSVDALIDEIIGLTDKVDDPHLDLAAVLERMRAVAECLHKRRNEGGS